jgi:hypothetical protein
VNTPERVLTLRELNRATLLIEPFEEPLSGERLLRFVAEPQGAETFEVRFV